jgi:hypothetical protein
MIAATKGVRQVQENNNYALHESAIEVPAQARQLQHVASDFEVHASLRAVAAVCLRPTREESLEQIRRIHWSH